jgi:DNA-directed RNA polymerase specialized sigma24 family protein
VRQIALCSVKLEHIETLLARAEEQLRKMLEDSKDKLTL